ncbi:sulfatase-like hydrolase/transferase [Halobellus sp. GM3]|uniref:sulfatase-like hydrolase/transferase n=1 Tax=Halobellus sp. GM3 TaxID=3458410 RepID=UPI00403D8F48
MARSLSADQPNVLLLISDQHNPRFRGGYSATDHGEPVSTPTLDRLAAESTEFEWAYCGMPLCTPSRLCLLTSRHAADAGAWGNEDMLPADAETLPETFSSGGYETCLVGKMHLGGTRQFGGFDHRPYGDLTGRAGHQYEPPNPQQEISPRATELLTEAGVTNIPESLLQEQNVLRESVSFLREYRNRNPESPWFLCASFNRPHWPRTAPKRFVDDYWPDGAPMPTVTEADSDTSDHPLTVHRRSRYDTDRLDEETVRKARAGYMACVAYIDEILNDFLTTLERDGFLEDTIVVYISDHGEMAGEHGLWDKNTWHEGSIRVPFFVSLPERYDADQPDRVRTPVSLLDLYPTLASLAGLDLSDEVDGTDLSRALLSGTEPDRAPVYVDNFHRSNTDVHFRVVRDGPYKYVRFLDADDLFFDLSACPTERTNHFDDADGAARQARDELRALAEEFSFEAADRKYRRDVRRRAERRLAIPRGRGNAYLMPYGSVIDADAFLYHPRAFTDSPSEAFADFPDDRPSESE